MENLSYEYTSIVKRVTDLINVNQWLKRKKKSDFKILLLNYIH